MKKALSLILALALLLGVSLCHAEAPLAGGWIVLEDDDAHEEIEERAEKALKKALVGLVGATYDEEAVLGYQIVAGTNYCLLCRVTPVAPGAVSHWALVYVYEALDGTCSLLAVQDLPLGIPEA